MYENTYIFCTPFRDDCERMLKMEIGKTNFLVKALIVAGAVIYFQRKSIKALKRKNDELEKKAEKKSEDEK